MNTDWYDNTITYERYSRYRGYEGEYITAQIKRKKQFMRDMDRPTPQRNIVPNHLFEIDG